MSDEMNGSVDLSIHDERHKHLAFEYDKRKRDEKRRGMVCRDFLRNMCKRGSVCKFQHPELALEKQNYSSGHDENGDCHKSNFCGINNISQQQDDRLHYKSGGELPFDSVKQYETVEHSVSPAECTLSNCKQHLWNDCFRENCNYKNEIVRDYVNIKNQCFTSYSAFREKKENICDRQRLNREMKLCELNKRFSSKPSFEPQVKRPFLNSGFINTCGDAVDNRFDNLKLHREVFGDSGYYYRTFERQHKRTYAMLEEENSMLCKRVNELKKRMNDLQVTNEFLLEQNARLRVRSKDTAGMTTVTVPAVTITNTVPGANEIQQTATSQQMVNAAIRVATVPVSLATVTPVSLAAVSMASVQQIPPPIVTMAQQPAPPSTDPQLPQQPLSISISGPTAPLVSYPIVSHPVMQPPPDLRH